MINQVIVVMIIALQWKITFNLILIIQKFKKRYFTETDNILVLIFDENKLFSSMYS